MAKYDGLLGQPVLEVEEPDKEGGITIILKDNRFMFIKAVDGKIETMMGKTCYDNYAWPYIGNTEVVGMTVSLVSLVATWSAPSKLALPVSRSASPLRPAGQQISRMPTLPKHQKYAKANVACKFR